MILSLELFDQAVRRIEAAGRPLQRVSAQLPGPLELGFGDDGLELPCLLDERVSDRAQRRAVGMPDAGAGETLPRLQVQIEAGRVDILGLRVTKLGGGECLVG